MLVRAKDIKRLKVQLAEDPDVGPDEQLRAVADSWIWNILALILGLAGFVVGWVAGFALLVWLMRFFDGTGIAFVSAWVAVILGMVLPAGAHQLGRRLQRRRLLRALDKARGRKRMLESSVSTSASSVAVPSSFIQR